MRGRMLGGSRAHTGNGRMRWERRWLDWTRQPDWRRRSMTTAAAKLDAWLAHDNVRVVRERDNHWEQLKALLHHSGMAGNLTTDAHLAALALTHDAVLVSCDNDFTRFKGLRWENPLRR